MKKIIIALFVFLPSFSFATVELFSLEELKLRPGEVRLIKKEFSGAIKVTDFLCQKKSLPFSYHQNVFQSFVVASYFLKPTTFTCELKIDQEGKSSEIEIYKVEVVAYNYKKESLKVAAKRIDLSKKDLLRYEGEKKVLDEIYKNFSKDIFFDGPFIKPSNLTLSSEYGTKRVFNKKKVTQHLGIDFRAPQGTPVLSSNKGKVVFAGDLFFSGKTILVDHGLSLFTMYAHLSKINCKVSDLVEKGQVLGESGKTGRVSGPHLHWGVKVDGLWVDGFTLPLQ